MSLSQSEINENAVDTVSNEQLPSTSTATGHNHVNHNHSSSNNISTVLVSEYFIENHVQETYMTPARKQTILAASSKMSEAANAMDVAAAATATVTANAIDSPKKKSQQHRSNQQNLSDVNSIESISDNTKMPGNELDWMDPLLEIDEIHTHKRQTQQQLQQSQHQNLNDAATLKLPKNNSRSITSVLAADQLDSMPVHVSDKPQSIYVEEDDKCVKCLHYTLMCCECSIS